MRLSGLIEPRLNCLASILIVMSGGNQALLLTCPIPSQQWSIVVAASCCGSVFQWRGLGDLSRLRESWTEHSPSNRTTRCAKLLTPYPRRLEVVIATKGASPKCWVKGLNTYVNVIFPFFLFNKFLNIFKILFLFCHYGVLSVDWWEKKQYLNAFSIT